jgi:protein AbiQ
VKLKKAQFDEAPLTKGLFLLYHKNMDIYKLSEDFYKDFAHCKEILQKIDRPYLFLLLTYDSLLYAVPFRSNIHHKLGYILDNNNSGLDFTKAVIITDSAKYINTIPMKIKNNEYQYLVSHKMEVEKKLAKYVSKYKKEIFRQTQNASIPLIPFCQFSCLQYFHKELGI